MRGQHLGELSSPRYGARGGGRICSSLISRLSASVRMPGSRVVAEEGFPKPS